MYIHIKVQVGMKKERWFKKSEDHFEVDVRQKAERNMANNKVRDLTAEHFNVAINKVRIVNGHHSPSKLLFIEK